MSFWVLLWLCISGVLIYFAVWTSYILLRQKKVWQEFAKKHNLRFNKKAFNETPEIVGYYKDYGLSIFACEHFVPGARSTRKLMAMEILLQSDMPFQGAAGNGGMIPIIDEIGYRQEVLVSDQYWDRDNIIRANQAEAAKVYYTDRRLKALSSLMKIKNAWVMLIFQDDTAILRIDMPDPLETEEKLTKLADKMVQVAQRLELEQGESAAIASAKAKVKDPQIDIDDNVDVSDLSLEE